MDAVDAELKWQFVGEVLGDELPHELGDVGRRVGIDRREAAPQKSAGERQVGAGRRHLGMREAIELENTAAGWIVGEGGNGGGGQRDWPRANEHVVGRGSWSGCDLSGQVVN